MNSLSILVITAIVLVAVAAIAAGFSNSIFLQTHAPVFAARLSGAIRSKTVWFNAVGAALITQLPAALPELMVQLPSLQPYLPEHVYQILMTGMVIINIFMRFRTTQALEHKMIRSALIVLALALGLVGFGYVMGGVDARIERDEARGQYASALAVATMERDAANARASNIEKRWSADIKEVGATYEGIVKNEKDTADRVIADLRNDVVRLRVRTATTHPGGGQLPGPAAGGAVDHGEADATLAGSVAARLAGRYAEYNGLVDQLDACQAVLLIERAPQL